MRRPLDVAGEGEVVLLRVVAEQRQAEAALALERAVAGAGVAAHAAEQAHDVPLEIDLLDTLAVGQFDVGGVRRLKQRAKRRQRQRWCRIG